VYYPVTLWSRIISLVFKTGMLFSTNAGVPGATFVSAIRLDSTNKLVYAWDGTQYVKIGDYA
jgi:hypothetical protein